jgi:multidrug efflux pump subunit AcrA (membrane-fusion protein)
VLILPLVAVGDSVSKGQELARLESPAFVSLQRDFVQALSQLDLASATAGREGQLAEEGIIAGRRAAESAALLRDARSRLEERRQALVLSGA